MASSTSKGYLNGKGQFPNFISLHNDPAITVNAANVGDTIELWVKLLKTGIMDISVPISDNVMTFQSSHALSNANPTAPPTNNAEGLFDAYQSNVSKKSPLLDDIVLANKKYANVGDKVYFCIALADITTFEQNVEVLDLIPLNNTGTDMVLGVGYSRINEDPGASTPIRLATIAGTFFETSWIIEGKTTPLIELSGKTCM